MYMHPIQGFTGGKLVTTSNRWASHIKDTVQPEILAVIKFGGLPPNDVFDTTGRLKIGSTVLYCHTYMQAEKKLADF